MDFKDVAGQLEGLWKGAMAEAEGQGRTAGEAAGRERVLQVAMTLAKEWDELAGEKSFVGFVAALRGHVETAPAENGRKPTEPLLHADDFRTSADVQAAIDVNPDQQVRVGLADYHALVLELEKCRESRAEPEPPFVPPASVEAPVEPEEPKRKHR